MFRSFFFFESASGQAIRNYFCNYYSQPRDKRTLLIAYSLACLFALLLLQSVQARDKINRGASENSAENAINPADENTIDTINNADANTARPLHPLASLTRKEIKATVALLKAQGKVSETTRFAEIALQEPEKQMVLNWQPGQVAPRLVTVTVQEPTTGQVWEGAVDLAANQVVRWDEKANVQSSEIWEEEDIGEALVKADPRWQAAMLRRGISDFEHVLVEFWFAGYFGNPQEAGLRLFRTPLFYNGDGANPYARPIEGVSALVNMTTLQVVEVIDTLADNEIPPVPGPAGFTENAVGPLRQAPKPMHEVFPEGPSYTIKNGEVTWQQWHFRFAFHPRTGLTLYTVGYEDNGRVRPILYRASLSEMVVPYGDPTLHWFYRNAFDVGEYTLGRSSDILRPGKECPASSTFFNVIFADDFGLPYRQDATVCLFEADADIVWKHYDFNTGLDEARRGRKLVLRWMASTGNYDYGFDWVFQQDGSLEQVTTATGIVLPKGVLSTRLIDANDPIAAADTRYGTLVAPNIVATNHQHFFNWRLDVDIEGQLNRVLESNVESLPPSPTDNPQANAFQAVETPLTSELQAQRDLNLASNRHWAVINPAARNYVGHPVGYALEPGDNAAPYAQADAWVRRRANFVNHHLWVTPYQLKELYAAGDYPTQSQGDSGLGLWTQANRPVVDTDVVLWYTMGLTHIPRTEDWPVMPVERLGFRLVPENFFDRNPAINLPNNDR